MQDRQNNGVRRFGVLIALPIILFLAATFPAAAQDADPPAAKVADQQESPTQPVAAVTQDSPYSDTTEPLPAVRTPTETSSSTGSTKSSAPKKRRGDVNPCMTPDPGFGIYDRWSRGPSIGQMIMPHKGGITKRGSFDVIIHFHGHEAVRKEFVKTAKGIVLVGIDLGIGSGVYASAFASPTTFTRLLDSIENAMAKQTGKKNARVRKLALSSWSAGYGAIEQILRQPAGKKVDALVLLDSLHAGYADEQAKTLKVPPIEPFIDFARRAAAGKSFMFMSHSSIIPPGYASTKETANFVVSQLKGKPRRASRKDVLGLDLFQRYDRGNFHVRGYTGDDKPDHCAHLGLIADVVRVHLTPRWKTPKGRR